MDSSPFILFNIPILGKELFKAYALESRLEFLAANFVY
jgi:hypothetical protein